MKKLIIVGALLLAACQSPGQGILNSCAAAASGLNMLTAMKAQGRLSTEQIVTIDSAVDVIDPICGAGEVPDVETALAALETQLLLMQGVIIDAGGAQ